MKSKTIARPITQRSKKYVSCIFEDYGFYSIGNILTSIRSILEVLIDLFPFYYEDTIFCFIKEFPKGIPESKVYSILKPVYLNTVFLDMGIFLFLEVFNCLLHNLCGHKKILCHFYHFFCRFLDFKYHEPFCSSPYEV